MKFRYSATDPDGVVKVGYVEADDEAAARDQLQARGIHADLIEPADDGVTDAIPDESGTSRLSSTEQIEAVGQISSLVSAGVPLSAGLRTLAEELPSRRLRETFRRMSDELDQGQPIEQVMQTHTGALPNWLRGLAEAGSMTGTLSSSVSHYVQFTRLRSRQKGRLLLCLAYPTVLITAACTICLVLLMWITPMFGELFEGFGTELPTITESLLQLSDLAWLLFDYWYITFPTIFLATGMGLTLSGILLGASSFRQLLYEVPIVGRMLKLISLAEFCHLLAMFVENRVPLPQAFDQVSRSTRDPHLSLVAAAASNQLSRGASAERLNAHIPEYPTELLTVSGWDSGEDELAESLRTASDLFCIQSDVGSLAIGGFVGPLAVFFVAGGVGLFVLALFMPLIKLLNDLS